MQFFQLLIAFRTVSFNLNNTRLAVRLGFAESIAEISSDICLDIFKPEILDTSLKIIIMGSPEKFFEYIFVFCYRQMRKNSAATVIYQNYDNILFNRIDQR